MVAQISMTLRELRAICSVIRKIPPDLRDAHDRYCLQRLAEIQAAKLPWKPFDIVRV